MVARTIGAGRYVASEGDMTIVANSYAPSRGGPLVLVCHGAGASALTYAPLAQRRDLNLLAETGCVVVCADLGGTTTWGNDTFLTRVDQVRTWAAAHPDLKADLTRMVMIGRSMGAMGALNYAWRNPSLVKGVALQAPVVAADALHDRDLAGIGALIDTAYGGGAAWDTAKPNRDPSATAPAALIAGLKDKYRIWYSTTDATVLEADITSFVALTGVRAIPLGAVTHDDTSIAAAIHARSQAEWLWYRINA